MNIQDTIKHKLQSFFNRVYRESPSQIETKVLLGTILAGQNAARIDVRRLFDVEFKVFSQFGEDGILQYLISKIDVPIKSQTFVEFGVESYREANTLLLLLKDNWSGLIIDGSESNMASVKSSTLYWRHNLKTVARFIDRDNINKIISDAGFKEEIGLLSVDIDGNDYWVWESITCVKPIIFVSEYNSVFGQTSTVSTPYDPSFQRNKAHFSNLYWGCSLGALVHVGRKKGYTLVGSNKAGNNAFFVRNDHAHHFTALTSEEAWVESHFADSVDESGKLTYLRGADRLAAIAHLPLIDVTNGATIRAGDL